MFFGSVFVLFDTSLWIIWTHLAILSSLLMLAIEDMRSYTIPDRLALPMIVLVLGVIGLAEYLWDWWIFPGWKYSILGGILWMVFYMVQMIIPAISTLISKKKYHDIFSVLLSPLFFPFWIGVKLLFGEKKADMIIPSIQKLDNLPSWVGGGDVRLGILLGLIVGPLYFGWIIGIGYTLGILFWVAYRLLRGTKLDILPVAPLLFLGFCAILMIHFFA
jgi:prepilin signal peptidase PulO-like enzyme (type II secretory pathway)